MANCFLENQTEILKKAINLIHVLFEDVGRRGRREREKKTQNTSKVQRKRHLMASASRKDRVNGRFNGLGARCGGRDSRYLFIHFFSIFVSGRHPENPTI